MANSEQEIAEAAYTSTSEDSIIKDQELARPDYSLDSAVKNIYSQAHNHREELIKFYILYTKSFTCIVIFLIIMQGFIRIYRDNFEIMPRWTLNILVTGMFLQFIGLLKIVTENAWNFKQFFDHHTEVKDMSKETADEEL